MAAVLKINRRLISDGRGVQDVLELWVMRLNLEQTQQVRRRGEKKRSNKVKWLSSEQEIFYYFEILVSI